MKKRNVIKSFAMNIAISFFFTSVFVLIVYVFFGKRIDYYISLANSVAYYKSDSTRVAKYNSSEQRLTKYPAYGDRYASISIPKIDLHLPLYNGDSLDILKYGVGQYVGSYFPGERGSALVAAHNKWIWIKIFNIPYSRFLPKTRRTREGRYNND